MNYIKLNINGKEYGAKLGTQFLENACKSEDLSIQDLLNKLQTDTLFIVPKLIYYSIETNCKRAGIENDLTINDIFDFIDENGLQSEQVKNFLEVFVDSIKVHTGDTGKVVPVKKVPAKKKD